MSKPTAQKADAEKAKWVVTVRYANDDESEDEAINHFCDSFGDGMLNKQITVAKAPEGIERTKEDHQYPDDYEPTWQKALETSSKEKLAAVRKKVADTAQELQLIYDSMGLKTHLLEQSARRYRNVIKRLEQLYLSMAEAAAPEAERTN